MSTDIESIIDDARRQLLERPHWDEQDFDRVCAVLREIDKLYEGQFLSDIENFPSYGNYTFTDGLDLIITGLYEAVPQMYIDKSHDGEGIYAGDLNIGVDLRTEAGVYYLTDFVHARSLVFDRAESGAAAAFEVVRTILDTYQSLTRWRRGHLINTHEPTDLTEASEALRAQQQNLYRARRQHLNAMLSQATKALGLTNGVFTFRFDEEDRAYRLNQLPTGLGIEHPSVIGRLKEIVVDTSPTGPATLVDVFTDRTFSAEELGYINEGGRWVLLCDEITPGRPGGPSFAIPVSATQRSCR